MSGNEQDAYGRIVSNLALLEGKLLCEGLKKDVDFNVLCF